MSHSCIVCNGTLRITGKADSRTEWYEQEYTCPDCNRSYMERVEFKTQSQIIDTDVLYINIGDDQFDVSNVTSEDVAELEKQVHDGKSHPKLRPELEEPPRGRGFKSPCAKRQVFKSNRGTPPESPRGHRFKSNPSQTGKRKTNA